MCFLPTQMRYSADARPLRAAVVHVVLLYTWALSCPRHRRDAGVCGISVTAMHDMSTASPSPPGASKCCYIAVSRFIFLKEFFCAPRFLMIFPGIFQRARGGASEIEAGEGGGGIKHHGERIDDKTEEWQQGAGEVLQTHWVRTPCLRLCPVWQQLIWRSLASFGIVRPFLMQSDSASRKRPFSTGLFVDCILLVLLLIVSLVDFVVFCSS